MTDLVIIGILGLIWHVFAIWGMLILGPYGKKWEGFYLGLMLGPVGLGLSFWLRARSRESADWEITGNVAGKPSSDK